MVGLRQIIPVQIIRLHLQFILKVELLVGYMDRN